MFSSEAEAELYAASAIEFKAWPKIDRWSKSASVVVTEKIDGSNACVVISPDGTQIAAQSRTKIVTPGKKTDNFGFAQWVEDNKVDLLKLGPGHHFGEWWGAGIQRTYGLTEKRFSLFNTARWMRPEAGKPDCCGVVPLLGVLPLENFDSQKLIADLVAHGSYAVPGYMNPEGLVFFIGRADIRFKRLVENDTLHKGEVEAA